MRFFLDSADPAEVRAGARRGLVEGVTASASRLGEALAASTTTDPHRFIEEICASVAGPVMVELGPGDAASIRQEARQLAQLGANLVVTIAHTAEGLAVARDCASAGIQTHLSGCSSPERAVLAARAGAAYVSPFGGPVAKSLEDGAGGVDLIRRTVSLLRSAGLGAQVLVTSVASRNQIVDLALAGVPIASVPLAVLEQLRAGTSP